MGPAASEDDTLAPIDPWIVLFIWRVDQRVVRFVLFDEILDGFNGSRGLPSLHVGLIGEILYLQSERFRIEVHDELDIQEIASCQRFELYGVGISSGCDICLGVSLWTIEIDREQN